MRVSDKAEPCEIKHKKIEFLTTENERKLFFALRKVLDANKYLIHCQTSLIALVNPVEFKHRSKAWTKRVDFVITDATSKVLAVIELDDYTHQQPKRVKRDEYVNGALKPHHPLIRIQTQNFYEPEKVAKLLEEQAGIVNEYRPSVNSSN